MADGAAPAGGAGVSVIDIDASGFDRFSGDLERAVRAVSDGIPGVVSRGALNVKGEWNAAFAASDSFAGVAGAVGYDVTGRAGSVEAEIGPNKSRRRAAALANIAHFGGVNGGGGTVADPQTFLDNEAPKFVSALERLVGEALS